MYPRYITLHCATNALHLFFADFRVSLWKSTTLHYATYF